MPKATDRKLPKGQAPGEAQEQEQFIQATGGREADGLFAPVAVEPDLEQIGPAEVAGAPVEAELQGLLFGPTQRPDESVNTSIRAGQQGDRLYQVLGQLAVQSGMSEDVVRLFDAARLLDL